MECLNERTRIETRVTPEVARRFFGRWWSSDELTLFCPCNGTEIQRTCDVLCSRTASFVVVCVGAWFVRGSVGEVAVGGGSVECGKRSPSWCSCGEGEATKQRVAKEVLGGDGVGITGSRKVSVTSCDARERQWVVFFFFENKKCCSICLLLTISKLQARYVRAGGRSILCTRSQLLFKAVSANMTKQSKNKHFIFSDDWGEGFRQVSLRLLCLLCLSLRSIVCFESKEYISTHKHQPAPDKALHQFSTSSSTSRSLSSRTTRTNVRASLVSRRLLDFEPAQSRQEQAPPTSPGKSGKSQCKAANEKAKVITKLSRFHNLKPHTTRSHHRERLLICHDT